MSDLAQKNAPRITGRKPLEIDSYVGLRLKMCRILRGMSQEQLGDHLGITFQQIQKYEKGINRISAGRLYEVAQLFAVPVTYFFEGCIEHAEVQVAEERV